MQRYLTLFLLLTYVTLTFAYDAKVKYVYYNLNKEKKTASVTYKSLNPEKQEWSTYSGNVEIPEKIVVNKETYKVTSIGDSAFFGCQDMEFLNLPSSITSIGKSAFEECRYNVTIDKEVSYDKPICYSLPSMLNSIGDRAFANSGVFRDVKLPNNLTKIGNEAFIGSNISSIYINEGLEYIGYAAFEDCKELVGVSIKSLVSWCKIEFESIYSNPLSSAHNLLLNSTQLVTDLVIPEEVTDILPNAFVATNFHSVTIPASVKSIGNYAFYMCLDLRDVHILNPEINIGENNFEDFQGNYYQKEDTTQSKKRKELLESYSDFIYSKNPSNP